MKALKVSGFTIGILAIFFFGIALFLPPKVYVERSLLIPAKADIVFNQINDLRKWKYWSPWHHTDPNMEVTYHGFLKGEGASYSWESNIIGDGKLVITESYPEQYISTKINFVEDGTATSFYRFEETEEGTQVIWGFETVVGTSPIEKYMGLFLDSRVGSEFEKGLQNLKIHVNSLPNQMLTDEHVARY